MPTRALVTSYRQDLRLFQDRWHLIGLALALAFVLIFPFVASDRWLTVGNLALIAIVGSVGLMILTGFAGQISLGHAAFLALGAYTVAIIGERWPLPFWLCLPIAGFVAAAVGLAVGPFALRLEGLYLAIVTLGLLFLVAHALLTATEWTHGVSGIAVAMYGGFPGPDERGSMGTFSQALTVGSAEIGFERKLWFAFLPVAALAAWIGKSIQRSNLGRAMMAVRDRDLAAAALGVRPARVKIVAFGISSFLAGVAGGMFAYQQQYITVEPPFDLNMSVQYIAMIVMGGIGTTFGAIWGAIAFVTLSPLAEVVGAQVPLLNTLSSAQQSTLLFSLVVIGFLIFEPLGLFGIWLRIKRYFVAWPFRY